MVSEGFIRGIYYLVGHGVQNDPKTIHTARIMIISVLPFIIVQLLLVLRGTAQVRLVILISLAVSAALIISFGLYQVNMGLVYDFTVFGFCLLDIQFRRPHWGFSRCRCSSHGCR